MTATIDSRAPGTDGTAARARRMPAGFRPAARRRSRLALGAALGVLALVGNLVAYSSLNRTSPVVQVVRDVPAGAEITSDMFRTVEVSTGDGINVVPAAQLPELVGRYAKVRLVAGSLLTAAQLQQRPLVAPASAVVAIEVAAGTLPIGLRERVPVQLVIPSGRDADGSNRAPTVFAARVVGLPTTTASAIGTQSLSVELSAADAPLVAAADDVRIVLQAPSDDPADGQGDGP